MGANHRDRGKLGIYKFSDTSLRVIRLWVNFPSRYQLVLWLKRITFVKEEKAWGKKNLSLILHLSVSMVPTSCTISLKIFYPNIFPLKLNAVALKIADKLPLISLQPNFTDSCCFTAHLAFATLASLRLPRVYLTCLRAAAHPALGGEKGNPLRFKSLVTPAGQTNG